MANLNKVLLIGRLTRDPEMMTFQSGGRVAKFGFAVNNRKKNQSTGQWEDEPVFLDVEAFNRENRSEAGRSGRAIPEEGASGVSGVQHEAGHLERQDHRREAQKLKFVSERHAVPRTAKPTAATPRAVRVRCAAGRPRRGPAGVMSRSNGPAPVHDDEEPEPMDAPPAHGGQEEDIPF